MGEGAKRFPVLATVDGYTWRTSVIRMGGEFVLGFSHDVRRGAAVEAGENIDVTVQFDAAPREVVVHEALAMALASDPEAWLSTVAWRHEA